MKIYRIYLIFSLPLFWVGAFAKSSYLPDSTGLPGDNFNLDGALEIFKSSSNLADFEQKINSENNEVNNLDLNGDGEVDYVKVTEYQEGNTRSVVLQVPVNETESQDVAVIGIEKNGDESAIIQITGDPDLYGQEQIVEPAQLQVNPPQRVNPNQNIPVQPPVVVNVWAWPTVRYMYAPGYMVYHPAWRWRVYPAYWHPWHPRPFRVYYGYPRPYRSNYQVIRVHRVVNAPRIYQPYRTTSVVVRTRYPANQRVVTKTVRVDKTNRGRSAKVQRVKTTKVVRTKKVKANTGRRPR
jgi:hypothetical protein